jgi:hypothetical protein
MIFHAILFLLAAASQPAATTPAGGTSPQDAAQSSSRPGAAAPPSGAIERVAWLQGCWESASPGWTIEENWMPPRGKSMIGVARTVRGDALLEYEMTVIREKDGKLAYEAHPPASRARPFRARADRGQGRLREPAARLPQRVGYKREGSDTLNAWVVGTMSGKTRRMEFPIDASCPGK